MAKPDDALNLALATLDRPAWPTSAPVFEAGQGVDTNLPTVEAITPDAASAALHAGLVAANRQTCVFHAERLKSFLAEPAPRKIIISAIDAEPAAPLQFFWLMANVTIAARMAAMLSEAFSADVRLALPDDLPAPLRAAFKSVGPITWITPRYPVGYHRLLARAAGSRGSATPLVLDVVALIDLASASVNGFPASARPVAVCELADRFRYRVVSRGTTVSELATTSPSVDSIRWHAGPRLADALVADDLAIGDDELTFYREARGSRFSSTCVRCGGCIEICPSRCDPVALLDLASEETPTKRRAVRAGLDACIDCGLCTAVCPSAIELHHNIASLRSRFEPEALR